MEVSIWCIFEWKWFKSSIINDDRSVRIEIDIKKYKNYMIEDKIIFESTKNTKLSGIDEYSEKTLVKNQKSPNVV